VSGCHGTGWTARPYALGLVHVRALNAAGEVYAAGLCGERAGREGEGDGGGAGVPRGCEGAGEGRAPWYSPSPLQPVAPNCWARATPAAAARSARKRRAIACLCAAVRRGSGGKIRAGGARVSARAGARPRKGAAARAGRGARAAKRAGAQRTAPASRRRKTHALRTRGGRMGGRCAARATTEQWIQRATEQCIRNLCCKGGFHPPSKPHITGTNGQISISDSREKLAARS